MLDKLNEKALDWILARKNYWPSALILAYAYYIFDKFSALSLHEITKHPWLVPVSAFVVIVLFLSQIFIWVWTLPEALPKDRLVILTAHFNEIGADAKEEGAAIAHRIIDELNSKAKDGAPLEARPFNNKIEPAVGETMDAAAKRIGKEPQTQAHLVLFGDIRREDGELYIKPSIAVIEKLGDTEIAGRELEPGVTRQGLGEPEYLALKETKARETADMAALITGLSFYRNNYFDKALIFLDTVHNNEAIFYRGEINYRIAESSSNPVPLLKKAAYEYNKALEVWKRYTLPRNWAATQNNLGNAYGNLGQRAGGAEGIDYLNKAVAAHNEALKVYKVESLPQDWAINQNNLGNAYRCLGQRAGGAEGIDYLNKAVAAYNEALKVYKLESLPQYWAMTQNNLGIAYRCLGQRAGEAEGIGYLNKSVAAFNEALKVRTRETLPQDWAMTQNNLGNAYGILGELAGGAEGIDYFNIAVAVFNEALKVRTRETLPHDWAMTQNNLGIAYVSLGERAGGAEGIGYLNKAVAAFDAALEVFTGDFHHERTKQNRQKALSAIAKLEVEQGTALPPPPPEYGGPPRAGGELYLPPDGRGKNGSGVNEND